MVEHHLALNSAPVELSIAFVSHSLGLPHTAELCQPHATVLTAQYLEECTQKISPGMCPSVSLKTFTPLVSTLSFFSSCFITVRYEEDPAGQSCLIHWDASKQNNTDLHFPSSVGSPVRSQSVLSPSGETEAFRSSLSHQKQQRAAAAGCHTALEKSPSKH